MKNKDLCEFEFEFEYRKWIKIALHPAINYGRVFLSEVMFSVMKFHLNPNFYQPKDIGTFTHNLIYKILKSGMYVNLQTQHG